MKDSRPRLPRLWLVYAVLHGTATVLYCSHSEAACRDYIAKHPRGPNGGSTHLDFMLLDPSKGDDAC